MQFFSFLIGFTVQAIFIGVQMKVQHSGFIYECVKTVIILISFLLPVLTILYAHYKTFGYVRRNSKPF